MIFKKISFSYQGCTPWQFIQALFKTTDLEYLSTNGKDDWIPLDTQSVINMYPDYNEIKPFKPTVFDVKHNTSDLVSRNSVLTDHPKNTQTGFDWRQAHLEEAFHSFSPNNQAHFNM